MEHFAPNLDLAKNFLYSMLDLKQNFHPDNIKAFKKLYTLLEKLQVLCLQSSNSSEIISTYFLMSETAEELLIAAHKVKNSAANKDKQHKAIHDHIVVCVILNLAGPLLPLVEPFQSNPPFTTLLERIERLINAQATVFDPSKSSKKNPLLAEYCSELSVFDETKIKAMFQSLSKDLHDSDLLTLVPSQISKIFRARKIVACLKDTLVFTQQASKAAKMMEALLEQESSEEVVADLAQQSYFGLLGCLLKFYLLRDLHHLHTNEDRPLAYFIPEDIQKLLDVSQRTHQQFYAKHLAMLGSSSIHAAPIYPDQQDWSLLIESAASGDLEKVKIALENKADVNYMDMDAEATTALISAAQNGYVDCLAALIAAHADVNLQDQEGFTALMVAAQNGYVNCVLALIDSKAKVDVQNAKGLTALMYAAEYGHVDCLKALIAAHADVNLQDQEGFTALMWAAWFGDVNGLRALIAAKADVDSKDQEEFTALMLTAQDGHVDCLKALIEAKANVNMQIQQGVTALMLAAKNGNDNCVEVLLEAGVDLNAINHHGWSASMFAARDGHARILKALLASGANPNCHSFNGWTGLMYAARNGHIVCVQALLKAKADPDAITHHGSNALMFAAREGHVEILKTLIEAKAQLDLQDSQGSTALMIAAKSLRLDCLKALLKAGANPNCQNKVGWSALHLSAEHSHIGCMKALIEAGADPNLAETEHWTALMLAAQNNDGECINALIAAGADPSLKNSAGQTALHIAADQQNPDSAKALIEAKVDVDAKTHEGSTALILAVQNKCLSCIKALLLAGADTNVQNVRGLTAIMIATKDGNLGVLKLLLDAKANSTLANKDGIDALAVATHFGLSDCKEASTMAANVESQHRPKKKKSFLEAGFDSYPSERRQNFQAGAAAAALPTDEEIYNEYEQELYDSILEAKSYDKVESILKKKGFVAVRNAGHKIFKAPGGGSVAVPTHCNDRPPRGTLGGIAKQVIKALR